MKHILKHGIQRHVVGLQGNTGLYYMAWLHPGVKFKLRSKLIINKLRVACSGSHNGLPRPYHYKQSLTY